MSYKVGDSFIIEIDRIYSSEKHAVSRYGIKGFSTLIFDDNGLKRLKPLMKYDEQGWELTGERIEGIKKEAYQKGFEDGYQKFAKIRIDAGDVPCLYCAYRGREAEDWPCLECVHNARDHFCYGSLEDGK